MNREDIIRMAREAKMQGMLTDVVCTYEELARFAALVASAEREACAQLAMTTAEEGLPEEMPEGEELLRAYELIAVGVLIAVAIRARGEQ